MDNNVTNSEIPEQGLWYKKVGNSKAIAGYPDAVYAFELMPENFIATKIFDMTNENIKKELNERNNPNEN
jgi:hypothetical protein